MHRKSTNRRISRTFPTMLENSSSPFLRCPCQTGLIRRVPLVLTETTAAAPMLAVTCILRKAPEFTRSPTAPSHADRTRFIAKLLEVDHGEFLARYGEIQKTTTVKQGDRIHAGEQIAKVGHLIGIQVPSDMLHLELYDKTASGPLTITDANRSKKRSDGIPFMRRSDLIDPTSRLNQWQVRFPKA